MHVEAQLEPPPLHPRCVRPMPPVTQLLSAACERVLAWARQRVRDDSGLEKLLHEAALAEDKVWCDLSVEMAEVALLVAEGLWEQLLSDTAASLSDLERSQQQAAAQELLEQQQQDKGLRLPGAAAVLPAAQTQVAAINACAW